MDFREYDWESIITKWFSCSTRKGLIELFNSSSQDAYVSGELPVLLKVSITPGESAFKHETSKFFGSGFRIRIVPEHVFNEEQCFSLAMVILVNNQIIRLLTALGWDTLEIVYNKELAGLKWELKRFLQLKSML